MLRNTIQLVLWSALAHASVQTEDCPQARNFIYVVPDGYGGASQVLARDYYSLMNDVGTVERPSTAQIGVDSMVYGI